LLALLTAAKHILPSTTLHVLTNGWRFVDSGFADLFDDLRGHVTWAGPLYADIARVHDFVVQSDSAFDETMHGLHNLGERGHHIEIRCVLHAQTVSLVAPYFDVLEQKDTMLRLEAGRLVAGSLYLLRRRCRLFKRHRPLPEDSGLYCRTLPVS
jgi:hypothetical protein